jgi:Putative esterase
MTGGGLAIVNQQVQGTNAGGDSGDIRTGEAYGNDQYSEVQVTSTRLSASEWVGPAVRAKAGGQDLYVGIYFWDNGRPKLLLFLRDDGNWTQLGATNTGPLAAGTTLTLAAVGSTLAFEENGSVVISASDNTLAGGSPAILANGTATAANWSGGNSGFQVDYQGSTNGVQTYDAISPENGYGAQTLRVVQPTHPTAGVAHNFLFVLPVEAGLGTTYGDGLKTLQALDAENRYNLTIVEPTFADQPWYADNPDFPNLRYQSFMTTELVPWVDQNLATTGTEQNWLMGFSKSGYGGQDLLLKYPGLFAVAASWDFPADMSSYDQFGSGAAANYGTEANFAADYQLTPAFVAAHKAPFLTQRRIWIGGYSVFAQDLSDYAALLASQGILYTTGPSRYLAHRWDSGWVAAAVAALYQDSLSLPPGP